MLRKLLLVLIVALAMPTGLATPSHASEPSGLSDARAVDSHPSPQQRKRQDRAKPADVPCVGCVTPSTLKRPLLEAPAPGLLMIPASLLMTRVA